ncbi:hypothetical protein ADIMK_0623 [Marinobacterium lacunae]|uniref:Uncharacterized protein n=1 Tax=Marinobacterium lacunae TaxID=1232683 RepID=A0A081G2B6_9GAMM|nr:hypothetical protein ADIMK_0623 [Marinobacterium lacunae]
MEPRFHLAESKRAGRWLKEHFDDPYVKGSRESGCCSRASFMLLEIDFKDTLINPGLKSSISMPP